MTSPSPAQIQAVIRERDQSGDARRLVAIRADATWTGPEVLEGTTPVRVVAAPSPLAARSAVVDHDQRAVDETLVLLTPCSSADLGLDLAARLFRGDVQTFDPFSSVLALFHATVLDPALAEERWLIDDLIALAPNGGWPNVALGGVLSIDAAWATWQHSRLGIADIPEDLAELLMLVDQPTVRQTLRGLADSARERVARRWGPSAPTATQVILRMVGAGEATSARALGLVVDTLWATTDDAELAQRQVLGRVRLEPLLGRDQLSAVDAAAWAAAATRLADPTDDSSGVVAEAEHLIATIDGRELAALSDVVPSGFDGRLDRLGAALGAGDLDDSAAALEDLDRHWSAGRRGRQLAAGRAAVRLLRRRVSGAASAADATFAGLAVHYRAELAWLEQARRDLAAGSASPALAAAFAQLSTEADAVQSEASTTFAEVLLEWSSAAPAPDPRLVPLERLLDEVVAPVARDAPVLLVVCDGMGLAVSHQLISDLRAEGWTPAGPASSGPWPVGVATLPTVTTASRTSMLTGQLMVGTQPEERAGFTSHEGLRQVSSATHPPVLFHKAGLVAGGGAALPDAIRAAVADPDQRIVGVVVNSVDDHLARGDQINVGWDLASLGPLAWLLDAAAEAGRVVVLTADHGHVLDHGRSTSRPQPAGGGERWRNAGTPPGPGEVVVRGPRVLLGDGKVVLPVDERIRYGPPKHGYHGGATPEEVLVPVEVLARRLPDGWTHQPVVTPPWWNDAPAAAPRPLQVEATQPRVVAAPLGAQPSLFEPAAAPAPAVASAQASWVDELLNSPAFAAHRATVRLPRPLPDERLRSYLDALAAGGGRATLTTLAAATGDPAGPMRMTLSIVQRLLNIDGSDILTVAEDGLVTCHLELLALQFDLNGPS